MLSLISDISVFKLFTSQYYFLRHIYTVYKATGTKADNYAGCRHYASICLYTLLYGILRFTLPMFQVGKLRQKSGCLGQYQLSWYNIKYIKISICNIVYRCILAMPLRFECCCESYVRLHNLTVVVCSHTSGLRSWGSRWSYIWAISLNLLMGTSVKWKMEQSFDCSMDGYLAESSPILFSAASSSFFFAAFRRLPPSSFCSIGSFINRASCFAA